MWYHLLTLMIKELILAIILGAVLGFGVTGGYFALNKNNRQTPNNQPTPTLNITNQNDTEDMISPVPTVLASNDSDSSALIIDSPNDEDIVSNSKITVKGTAPKDSILIIQTPIKTYTLKVASTGNFTEDIDIESGANIIHFTSVDSSGNQIDKEILVTYSTAKI